MKHFILSFFSVNIFKCHNSDFNVIITPDGANDLAFHCSALSAVVTGWKQKLISQETSLSNIMDLCTDCWSRVIFMCNGVASSSSIRLVLFSFKQTRADHEAITFLTKPTFMVLFMAHFHSHQWTWKLSFLANVRSVIPNIIAYVIKITDKWLLQCCTH